MPFLVLIVVVRAISVVSALIESATAFGVIVVMLVIGGIVWFFGQ